MEFDNINSLFNYFNNTVEGQSQLFGDQSIIKTIEKEALRLEKYIKDAIQEYYNSYQPKVYKRTFAWMNSVRVGKPYIENGYVYIEIYFDKEYALHPSIMKGNYPDGYVPWLMEVGWNIRDKVKIDKYRFTHFEGTHYIRKSIEKWEQENKYGLQVAVYLDGERYL